MSKNLLKQIRESLPGYAFLLPWFAGLFILTLYPIINSLYLSFTQFNMLNPPVWIGWSNFKTMFTQDKRFLNSLYVTCRFVLLGVPAKLVFALFVAVIMNQRLRFISFYRTVYYIPTLLGGSVAIAVLWRRLFSGDGAINAIIMALTGIKAPAWISNPRYALYTLVLLAVWQFGSSMIIFLAGLKQIPGEYYEAASVDGAGKVTQFFRITLPCLSPIIFFNLVMQMITSFQSFTQAFVVSGGQGGPLDSTMFYSLYLYIQGFSYFQMGYAAAMAWFLLIIIAAVTALIFKSSALWVSYGSGE
jgi:multiple sugar transport system permease protein